MSNSKQHIREAWTTGSKSASASNLHVSLSLSLSLSLSVCVCVRACVCVSLTRNATDRMLSLDSPDTRLPSTATDSLALAHSDDDRRWLYGDVSRFPENTRLPINSCVELSIRQPFQGELRRMRRGQGDGNNRRACVCKAARRLSGVLGAPVFDARVLLPVQKSKRDPGRSSGAFASSLVYVRVCAVLAVWRACRKLLPASPLTVNQPPPN